MAISARLVGKGAEASSSTTTAAGTSSAAGSTFLLGFSYDASTTVASVPPDSNGNTYTKVGLSYGDSGARVEWWASQNAVGGASHTATVTFSGTAFAPAYLIEVLGAEPSGIDITTGRSNTVQHDIVISVGPFAQADELVLAITGSDGSGTVVYSDTTATFTKLSEEQDGNNFWTSAVWSRVVSATTAITTGFSNNQPGGSFLQGSIISIKQAAASSGGVTAALDLSDIFDTLSAAATVWVAAALSQSDVTDAISSESQVSVSSSLVQTDAADSLDSSGSIGVSGVSAVLDQNDAADSLTAAASVSVSGVMSQSDSADATSAGASVGVSASLAQLDLPDSLGGAGGPSVGSHGEDHDLQGPISNQLQITVNTQPGSTFLVFHTGLVGNADPVDNKGNSLARLTPWTFQPLWTSYGAEMFGVVSGSGGSSHTFTVDKVPSSRPDEEASAIAVEVIGGTQIVGPDIGYVATASPPYVTPTVTVDGPAVVFALWSGENGDGPHSVSASDGFTFVDGWLDGVSGSIQFALFAKSVTAAGTYGTTFTSTPAQGGLFGICAVLGGTGTASGVVAVACALSQSDADDTASSTSSIAISGAFGQSDAADTLSAGGSVPIAGEVTGVFAQTDALDTLEASAAVAVSGTLAESDSSDSLSGAGVVLVAAALSQSDLADTVASSSGVAVSAALEQADAADAAASTTSVAVTAEAQPTDEPDSTSSNAGVAVSAALSQSDAADSLLASGLVSIAGTISGTFDQIDQADSLSATGVVLIGASGSILDSSDGLSSSAAIAIAAAAAMLDQQDALAADGAVTVAATRFATLVMLDDADSLSADGSVSIGAVFAQSDALDSAVASGAVFTVGQLVHTDAADAISASMVHFTPGRKLLPATTVAVRLNPVGSGIIEMSEVIAIGRPQE